MGNQAVRARPELAPVAAMDYATFLSRLSDKDRRSFERQLSVWAAKRGQELSDRWCRFACVLMSLAPFPAKLTSLPGIQFFIPDGKYRKQVFALHGLPDGSISLYAPDILAAAVRTGLVHKPRREQPANAYQIRDSAESLTIDSLDGKVLNPDAVFKDMTGWNRRAIRITIAPSATEVQCQAAEQLCSVAAADWAGVTAPERTPAT